MGSKMAAATRVVQRMRQGSPQLSVRGANQRLPAKPSLVKVKVVKPHTPLIKFPDRKSSPRPKIQESLQASVPSLHDSQVQESVGGRSLAFQSSSPVSRVRGTPDTSELARTLPQKYRRKFMTDEEIEFIQRGGPE